MNSDANSRPALPEPTARVLGGRFPLHWVPFRAEDVSVEVTVDGGKLNLWLSNEHAPEFWCSVIIEVHP